jgi:glycosyltransferase involved in cell wall biosynthesis
VLSVPTVYREAKGLYVLEALAAGVPVVQPDHGAFPELIAATGGGLLCTPEDPAALAAALAQLMDDPTQRNELAQRGRSAVRQAHTDQVMAERTWRLYEQYHRA